METLPLKIWPEILMKLLYSSKLKRPRECTSLGEKDDGVMPTIQGFRQMTEPATDLMVMSHQGSHIRNEMAEIK